MVKKATTKKTGAKARKSDDNQLAAAIRDSAQQILNEVSQRDPGGDIEL